LGVITANLLDSCLYLGGVCAAKGGEISWALESAGKCVRKPFTVKDKTFLLESCQKTCWGSSNGHLSSHGEKREENGRLGEHFGS
jgi:hypothetical protein